MPKSIFSLCVLLLTLALAACGQVKADLSDSLLPELAVKPTQPEPTAEATTPVEAEPEPVDECIACHSNKELLIEVAEPVVEAESESSGTG